MDKAEGKPKESRGEAERQIAESRQRIEAGRTAEAREREAQAIPERDAPPNDRAPLGRGSLVDPEARERLKDFEIRTNPEGDRRRAELSGTPMGPEDARRLEEAEPALAPKREAAERPLRNRVPLEEGRPETEAEIDREIDRRIAGAERDWRQAPPRERGQFAREVGQDEHRDWENEIRRTEAAKGRVEGADYGIEYEVQHPDGGFVRYDYVDFKEHRIVDRKAQAGAETDLELAKQYLDQQRRHTEAYEARFGVTPAYEYSPYPSTKDLYGTEE